MGVYKLLCLAVLSILCGLHVSDSKSFRIPAERNEKMQLETFIEPKSEKVLMFEKDDHFTHDQR